MKCEEGNRSHLLNDLNNIKHAKHGMARNVTMCEEITFLEFCRSLT